jgi:hypothetical protein
VRHPWAATRPATRRDLLAAVVAALAVIAVTAGPAAATAEPTGQCTTTSGVILAVDFGAWGGPVLRSCGSTPTTGYALLNQGGWRTTGTNHDGPTFICRIGYAGYAGGAQYPTQASEACIVTPPADAYWSYWHADPGQHSWSYSQAGPASDHPLPGSVELWTFGATNVSGSQGVPTLSPDALRARNTTPSTGTAAPTPAPSHPASLRPSIGSSRRTTSPTAAASLPAGAGTGSSSAGPAVGAGSGPTVTGTGVTALAVAGQAVDAQPVASSSGGAGTPLAMVAGLGLVALLAAAAALVRRRRADRT